jgi:flagellar protein FlbT
MALKFSIPRGEKVIINGAVISGGDKAITLYLLNKASFLRGREILKDEDVTSPERELYFLIQLIYLFPDDAARTLPKCKLAFEQMRQLHPQHQTALSDIEQLVDAENYHKALKTLARLFQIKPRRLTVDGEAAETD